MKRFNCIGLARLVLVTAAIAFLSGCVTNPETGRRQLLLVPESEMTQLGLTSFNQMKKEVPISKDAKANELVQRVGKRIASVVNLPGAQWEFVVFESKEANAFCLPGGKIGVYTGILPITKDDAGLAAVMGHEVAHATLQHGRERMSEGMARSGESSTRCDWADSRAGPGPTRVRCLEESTRCPSWSRCSPASVGSSGRRPRVFEMAM